MTFLMHLRTFLFFASLPSSVIASPCQQKRDDTSSLDLFSPGESSLNDDPMTLAFAPTTTDSDLFSSSYADLGLPIFSGSTDGSSSAAADGLDGLFQQNSDLDSATDFNFDDGSQAMSDSLFFDTDSEMFSGQDGQDLVAQLPDSDFGGITDSSFELAEKGKSCPADEAPTTSQPDRGGFPGITDETIGDSDGLTEEDRRKCPKVNGKQLIPLCCFSNFNDEERSQYQCYRRM